MDMYRLITRLKALFQKFDQMFVGNSSTLFCEFCCATGHIYDNCPILLDRPYRMHVERRGVFSNFYHRLEQNFCKACNEIGHSIESCYKLCNLGTSIEELDRKIDEMASSNSHTYGSDSNAPQFFLALIRDRETM